ncbi:MAG: GNAT family N-acetyltransferase [Aeromicrobium sp.]
MTAIEVLDPTDDPQFAEFHAVYVAAKNERWDRPYTAREQRAELLEVSGYTDTIGLIARNDAGIAVGMALIEFPLKDNLALVYVGVNVAPAHRRLGHGTAIAEAVAELARERGRTTLFAEARWNVDETSSGHTAFAEARGFHLDLVDAHRVLCLPPTLPDAPARDGYTLQTWRGPCPEEWIDQYANLLTLIVQEAPSGEYGLENEFFDAARVRSDEALLALQQRQMQVAVALLPEGEVAGHTQLVFPAADPENVYQWDTLVLKEHRGHGLGLTLKVAALEASADLLAGRKYVHTYNAVSNGPMIAVNELMGFRLVSYVGEFIAEA